MAIPIIPIVAVLGAGTLGYFIGRETAPCPASLTYSGDADDDGHDNDNQDQDQDQDQDEETASAAAHEPRSGGSEAGHEAAGSAWVHMSRAEALEILQLAPDATPDAIREAHRRIARRIRPDKGGSRYLATAVDRAKVVLLG